MMFEKQGFAHCGEENCCELILCRVLIEFKLVKLRQGCCLKLEPGNLEHPRKCSGHLNVFAAIPNTSLVGLLTSRLLALWAPGDFGEATTFSVLVDLKYTSKLLLSYAQSFILQYWPKNSSTCMYTRVKCVQYGVFTRKNGHFARAKSDMNCYTSLNYTQFGCI